MLGGGSVERWEGDGAGACPVTWEGELVLRLAALPKALPGAAAQALWRATNTAEGLTELGALVGALYQLDAGSRAAIATRLQQAHGPRLC